MSCSSYLEVAYLGDTSWDDRLVSQELKFKVSLVDLADIEVFIDNLDHPIFLIVAICG